MHTHIQQELFEAPAVEPLFENLPKIIRPEAAASALGISVKTIYDWHYRRKLRKVPQMMFFKVNRLLYLRTDILRKWISSQNPSQP